MREGSYVMKKGTRVMRVNKAGARAIESFLQHLSIMSGTGNGIGQATVRKLREIALKDGFIEK